MCVYIFHEVLIKCLLQFLGFEEFFVPVVLLASAVSLKIFSDKVSGIPCSMKILREFYFADLGFFVVCGNKFLRLEMTEISSGN